MNKTLNQKLAGLILVFCIFFLAIGPASARDLYREGDLGLIDTTILLQDATTLPSNDTVAVEMNGKTVSLDDVGVFLSGDDSLPLAETVIVLPDGGSLVINGGSLVINDGAPKIEGGSIVINGGSGTILRGKTVSSYGSDTTTIEVNSKAFSLADLGVVLSGDQGFPLATTIISSPDSGNLVINGGSLVINSGVSSIEGGSIVINGGSIVISG